MKAATYVTILPCSLFVFFLSITLHVLEWEQQPFVRQFESLIIIMIEQRRPYRVRIDPFVIVFFLLESPCFSFLLDFIADHIFSLLIAYSTRLSGAVRLTLNTSNWWDSTPPLLCSRSYQLFLFRFLAFIDDNDDDLKCLLCSGKLLFFSQYMYMNGFTIYIFMTSMIKQSNELYQFDCI
jgi:hypothetical protein